MLIGNMALAAGSAPPPKAEEEVSEFLPISPISVAMYNKRQRPNGTMTVIMQLQIEDGEQRTEAEKILPRLTNAYMQETLKLAMNFLDVNRPININMLSRVLQGVTNRILRHEHARVLIGDVAVQKR